MKFQNSNTLYNVYDAGNFLTGKAFNMVGITLRMILNGANLNRRLPLTAGRDSVEDQRTITNGFNFNGIKWKK